MMKALNVGRTSTTKIRKPIALPLHIPFSTSNDGKRRSDSTCWSFSSSIISALSITATFIAYNAPLSAYSQEGSANTDNDTGVSIEKDQKLLNWSSTHSCCPDVIYYPKSAQEISRVLSKSSNQRSKIRPVGTALSPNGIGLSTIIISAQDPPTHSNLMSLAGLDYVEGICRTLFCEHNIHTLTESNLFV